MRSYNVYRRPGRPRSMTVHELSRSLHWTFDRGARRPMAANVLEFTDANWKSEVLESTVPVMVDFWAPWCGPCRMLAPTIEKLAGELEGKVKIGKMNTDENQETPGGLRISAIPTVLIFQAGKEVDRLVGVNTETKFKASLQKLGVS